MDFIQKTELLNTKAFFRASNNLLYLYHKQHAYWNLSAPFSLEAEGWVGCRSKTTLSPWGVIRGEGKCRAVSRARIASPCLTFIAMDK